MDLCDTKKGYKLDNVTAAEPLLVQYRTKYNTFSINLKNHFTMQRIIHHAEFFECLWFYIETLSLQ